MDVLHLRSGVERSASEARGGEGSLPDMPAQLALIATRAVWTAVAEVCRTVGRLLAAEERGGGGGGGGTLAALVGDALQLLREATAVGRGEARVRFVWPG